MYGSRETVPGLLPLLVQKEPYYKPPSYTPARLHITAIMAETLNMIGAQGGVYLEPQSFEENFLEAGIAKLRS